MIDKLTTAGNRRVMRAARDYAQTLLAPLANYVYRLGARNDKKLMAVEALGGRQMADPSQWVDEDQTVTVHAALTPDAARKYAADLQAFDMAMKSDAEMAALYTLQEKHAVWDEILDALGIADSSRFLKRPDDPQVQMGMQQQGQAMQQEKAKQDGMLKETMRLADSDDKREWEKLKLEATDKLADNVRNDRELAHDKIMDFEELALEKVQNRDVRIN